MAVFIAVLSAFAIIGFVSLIKEFLYGDSLTDKITVYTLNRENDIEYVLRSLKYRFPDTEIELHDLGSCDLTTDIADRLDVYESNKGMLH